MLGRVASVCGWTIYCNSRIKKSIDFERLGIVGGTSAEPRLYLGRGAAPGSGSGAHFSVFWLKE